jgi:hypothetical protein
MRYAHPPDLRVSVLEGHEYDRALNTVAHYHPAALKAFRAVSKPVAGE